MKKGKKQQLAYQFIHSRIIEGIYVPGQRLIIDEIAKELSTSIIPIREALHRLEAVGLVEIKPYSGAVVTSIDENEYFEILSTLAVLEAYAARLSFPNYPNEKIKELAKINDKIKKALENYDILSFIKLNTEFHILSNSYCPNKYLLKEIEKKWRKLDTVRRIGIYPPTRAKEAVKEHETILLFMEVGKSPREIEDYIRNHHMKAIDDFNKNK